MPSPPPSLQHPLPLHLSVLVHLPNDSGGANLWQVPPKVPGEQGVPQAAAVPDTGLQKPAKQRQPLHARDLFGDATCPHAHQSLLTFIAWLVQHTWHTSCALQ